MLDQYIAKMWFQQAKKVEQPSAAEQKIIQAQEKAVDNMDDFKFCLNIAVDKNNVERNPVNAANIFKYFEREIAPAWKKLDERLQLACRLDWYGALWHALEEISKIPRALLDKESIRFAKSLGLGNKWAETKKRYEALEQALPEGERLTGFDRYLEQLERELIEPQRQLWRKAERRQSILDVITRIAAAFIICVIAAGIASYVRGVGPVAKLLGNEKMEVYTDAEEAAANISGFGTYEPVDIADFNASSIRTNMDGVEFSDRYLMDGDPATAWEEGEPDAGINRRLYFNVRDEGPVHYLVIWNGNQKNSTSWRACNRLRDVTIRINDKSHDYRVTLQDTASPQYIRIARGDVQKFWIIIDSVYDGTDPANITAVSEVAIY